MTDKYETLEELRDHALAEGLAFGVTRLKTQFRMKPKKGARPFKWIKSPHNRRQENPIYLIKDCVPMRKPPAKIFSEKKELYNKILAIKAKLRSKGSRAAEDINAMLNKNTVLFMDAETSGICSEAQAVQIAIRNHCDQVIYHTLLKPSVEVSSVAKARHGFTNEDLKNCPDWSVSWVEMKKILKGKVILMYNKELIFRVLKQTAQAHDCPVNWLNNLNLICMMNYIDNVFCNSNQYSFISLFEACSSLGVEYDSSKACALNDTHLIYSIVQNIKSRNDGLYAELALLEQRRYLLT
jgi:DNA polymerase III alpha subunit (gram-positive type)